MDVASQLPGRATWPSPSCALETLNIDVIILILSAARSLEDLGACIRASPILYRAFLLAKTSILLRVGVDSESLGPATKDIVILADITIKPFVNDNSYYDRVEKTVAMYRRRLLLGQALWTADISFQTAVCIVRLNRTIQYFVDLYIGVRLAYFKRNLDSRYHWFSSFKSNHLKSRCHRPATEEERQRIAQAFVRYQIIVSLSYADGTPPRDRYFLLTRIYALFEPWEMEQVSQVDHFICALCTALVRCEKMSDGLPFTIERENAMVEAARAIASRGGPILKRGPRDGYHHLYISNLAVFRAKLLEASSTDVNLVREIMDHESVTNGRVTVTKHPFCNARRYVLWPDTPNPPPPSVPCNLISDSPVKPPRGWMEALGKRNDRDWGLDLLPSAPPGTPAPYWIDVERKFKFWRWLGLVFWDAGRVEAINNTKQMADMKPGWLEAPWG
jgi:hypothetical protein